MTVASIGYDSKTVPGKQGSREAISPARKNLPSHHSHKHYVFTWILVCSPALATQGWWRVNVTSTGRRLTWLVD
jgi:hypothetical protein